MLSNLRGGFIVLAVFVLGILAITSAVSACEDYDECDENSGSHIDISNKNVNTQEQSQENVQEVNIEIPAVVAPRVISTSAKVPVTQPETGAGVMSLVSVLSAAPVGLALLRYKQSFSTNKQSFSTNKQSFSTNRKNRSYEESLGEIATGLVDQRNRKLT